MRSFQRVSYMRKEEGHRESAPRIAGDLKIGLQTELAGQRRAHLSNVGAVTGEECTGQKRLQGTMSGVTVPLQITRTSTKNWASKLLGVESKGVPWKTLSGTQRLSNRFDLTGIVGSTWS